MYRSDSLILTRCLFFFGCYFCRCLTTRRLWKQRSSVSIWQQRCRNFRSQRSPYLRESQLHNKYNLPSEWVIAKYPLHYWFMIFQYFSFGSILALTMLWLNDPTSRYLGLTRCPTVSLRSFTVKAPDTAASKNPSSIGVLWGSPATRSHACMIIHADVLNSSPKMEWVLT